MVAITVNSGTPTLTTLDKQFGTSSLKLDVGESLKFPHNDNFIFPGQFTFECWIKYDLFSEALQKFRALFGTSSTSNLKNPPEDKYLWWTTNREFGDENYSSQFFWRQGGVAHPGNEEDFGIWPVGASHPNNTWGHIYCGRDASNILWWGHNGFQQTKAGADPSTIGGSGSFDCFIGAASDNILDVRRFDILLDELRISNTFRYGGGATYTVPTAAFPANEANTVLLCHFNGANGSSVFTDDTLSEEGFPKVIMIG